MRCICSTKNEIKEPEAKKVIKEYMDEIKRLSGWEILYACKVCGSYWEIFYPYSESHGGGPIRLRKMNNADAGKKYHVNIST
jgi:hypothetical protein